MSAMAWKNVEARRAYKREWMRRYRAEHPEYTEQKRLYRRANLFLCPAGDLIGQLTWFPLARDVTLASGIDQAMSGRKTTGVDFLPLVINNLVAARGYR
jgi:hypothetical protein